MRAVALTKQLDKSIEKLRDKTIGVPETDIFTVVVISDIHDGNINAVCTPKGAKFIKHPSKKRLQKKLYVAWKWCSEQLTKKEIDLLIVNGDAIDGDNRKDLGSEVWTTSMLAQIRDAVELITSHYTFRAVIVTNGSGYHVKRGADPFEDDLAERLASYETDPEFGEELRSGITTTKKKNATTRANNIPYNYSDYKWKFKAANEVFSVTHHVSHSKVEFYRSTPLAREMVTTELDASKYSPKERPTILIRSHTHYYCLLEFSGSVGLITPAWKFPDEYLHRGGIGGTAPTIGIVEIVIYKDGEKKFRKILAKGIKYPKEGIVDITRFMFKKK